MPLLLQDAAGPGSILGRGLHPGRDETAQQADQDHRPDNHRDPVGEESPEPAVGSKPGSMMYR